MFNSIILYFFIKTNEWYKWIFLALSTISMIIYFSPEIGLGAQKDFFLYKIFGLHRSSAFLGSLYAIILFGFQIITMKHIKIANYTFKNPKMMENIIFKVLIFLTFLSSCINYVYKGTKTQFNAFKYTSYNNFPGVVNNIYDDILAHDFFTNAIMSTPRIIVIKLLELPTKIGIDWYDGVYLLDLVNTIIYLPLLFILINAIVNIFHTKEEHNFIKTLFIYLFTFLLIWSRTIEELQPDRSLIGWPSAFPILFGSDAHSFSINLGILYLYFFVKKKFPYSKIACSVLLTFCTLLHILHGLAIFSLATLYYLSSRKIYFDRIVFFNFLFGIIFPIIFLISIYDNPNPISAERFIEIYNLSSHAYHYKISELIGQKFIIWLFSYFILIFLSVKMKNTSLIKLSILSTAYFIIPTVFQFFGTEIWKIKFIGILGLNRFSQYNSFIFCTNCLIIFSKTIFFNKTISYTKGLITNLRSIKEIKHTRLELYIHNYIKNISLFFFGRPLILSLFMIITLITVWEATKHNPLENYFQISKHREKRYTTLKALCDYIKDNLEKDAVIFINTDDDNSTNSPLSITIKCFGHRATFADYEFPFNESAILEWQTRLVISESFESSTIQSFLKTIEQYPISHILTTNNHKDKFKNFKPIWNNNEFSIFKIKDINSIH